MTGARKDGGPAFPLENPRHLEDGELFKQFTGMSLRDWFAGQALAGFMASQSEAAGWFKPGDAAVSSYEMADAMLAAREASR